MIIKVAGLQMSLEWGKELVNAQKALMAIDKIPKGQVHVICLPELFTTGFDYAYLRARDPKLTWQILTNLAEKAKEKGVYILAGTLPEKQNDSIYNTLFVINPEGEQVGAYRKIHLFPLMGEDGYFCAGENILVCDTPWGKIGTAVCYDLRFPDLFQSIALAGAKIIFVPAQFPSSRIEHWDTLLKARAIENQVFVVGVNRTGKDSLETFSGHSSIYDPMGKLIAWAEDAQGWIIGSIDLEEIERVRSKLPALFYNRITI